MLEKKKYIKPVTQVIIVDIPVCNQMLSGSGNTGYDANTQKPLTPPSTSTSDEELGGGEDLEGAKMNYSNSIDICNYSNSICWNVI